MYFHVHMFINAEKKWTKTAACTLQFMNDRFEYENYLEEIIASR